jgi:hypothetical protein
VKTATLLLTLLPAVVLAGGATHFDLQATFVPPPKAKTEAAIAVFFTAKNADVRVNEDPAPRIKLDQAQTVLVANPSPKAEPPPAEPGTTRYLDLTAPVRFPVTLGTGATKGTHLVKASVSYFYCSKREGWCRKGTSEVEIPVLVR